MKNIADPVVLSFVVSMQILDFTEGVEGEEAAVAEAEAAAAAEEVCLRLLFLGACMSPCSLFHTISAIGKLHR